MTSLSTIENSNRLLAALSPADLGQLRLHLTAVKLKLRHPMERPGKPIEDVYFMSDGIASVVAVQPNDTSIEIGLIGREGMSGSAVVLGADRSPNSTYIQVEGAGARIAADDLRKAMQASETLRRQLLKYVQAFTVQTAHTAVANARGRLPERLARWLLMAQDRVGGDTVALTHEFIALMLGVRRAGVTETVQTLTRKNLIRAARGQITILDRKGLERAAGDFYGVPEREYRRLFG
jgi:CRP-like cAMP-binding protein